MADYKYNLDIDVQSKGLKETRAEIQKLKDELKQAKADKNIGNFLDEKFHGAFKSGESLRKTISKVEKALDELDKKGDSLTIKDLASFNADVSKAGVRLKTLDSYLESVGKTGVASFGKLSTAMYDVGYQVDRVDDKFAKLGSDIQHEVVDNIVRMGFDAVTNAINKAIYFTKDLDRTLTDIRIVTGLSAEDMANFAEESNEAARALGSTTDEFAKSSLIFYQQGGYSLNQVKDLAEATTIAANITRQSTAEVADQLTAVINSFGVEVNRVMPDIVDVFAKIGAVSGSNFEELASATQKFASQAKTAGYEGAKGIQEMGSQIAVVVETTRQSAESIGVGFKTILARLQGIKEDKSGEMVTKLSKSFGQLNAELKQLGATQIDVFDQFGDLKGADEIITDLGNTWHTYGDQLTEATKAYVMQQVAGVEQASRLAALFDNWDRYLEILDEAQTSQGTALQQQLIYMDSIDAKAGQMRTAFEEMVLSLNLEYVLKGSMGIITDLTDSLGSALEGFNALGEGAAEFLGISKELGGTLGAWAPIISNVVGIMGVLFGKTIALRLANKDAVNGYYQQLGAQQSLTEGERQRLAIHQQINKNLGIQQAQKYGQIQEKIIQNSKDQLKLETHVLTILDESIADTKRLNQEEIKELETVRNRVALVKDLRLTSKEIINQEKTLKQVIEESNLKEKQRYLNLIQQNEATMTREQLEKRILSTMERQRGVQEGLINREKGRINEILRAKRDTAIGGEAEIVRDLDVQNTALDSNARAIENRNTRIEKARKYTSALMGATMGLTTIVGAVNTAFGEEQDKSKALAQAMMGLATSIVGVVFALGQIELLLAPWMLGIMALIATIGLIATNYKSEAEKVKAANEEITKTFVEQKDRIDAMKASLQGVKGAYDELLATGMTAQEILASGNDDLIAKYEEYANAIAATNPEAIKGYDAQGRALVDLKDSYDSVNASIKEQERLNYSLQSGNVRDYTAELSTNYKNASVQIQEMTEKQATLQKQLATAGESKDTQRISELSAELATLNGKIGEQRALLSDTSALIQSQIVLPFFKSNKSVISFNDTFGNMIVKTKDGTAELGSAFGSVALNIDAINLAVRSGDINRVEELMNNSTKATEYFNSRLLEAKKISDETAASLASQFTQMPEHMQKAAFAMQGAFGDAGFDAFDNFEEGMDKVLIGAQNIETAFGISGEEIDKALGEDLQNTLNNSTAALEDFKQKGLMLDSASKVAMDYDENLKKLEESVERAKGQMDDYNESIEDGTSKQDRMNEMLYDALDAMDDTAEGYNKIVEGMKSVGETIDELEGKSTVGMTEEQLAENSSRIEALKEQYYQMYIALNDESASFYQSQILSNEEWVKNFEESTGLKATDYSTLQELMNASEAAGVDTRSWLADEETRRKMNARATDTYNAQVNAVNQINTSKFAAFEIIRHFNALHNAGFTTGQLITAAFLDAFGAIVNQAIGMANTVLSIFNKIAQAAASVIPGGKKGGDVKAVQIGKVSLGKSYLSGVAKKQKTAAVIPGLDLEPTPPPKLAGPKTKPGGKDKVKPGGGAGGDKGKDKGKDKEKKEVEDVELDLDPLYQYLTALKLIDDEISILKTKEKDLFGKDLIDNLAQQNDLLAKKLEIMKSESAVVDTQLANQKKLLSTKGFSFDDKGLITNYNQIIEKLTAEVNAKTGESKKKAIEDLKQVKEVVKDYDKLLTDTSNKLEEDMIKITQELQENYQQQIEVVIDVNLDLSKAYEKVYEFQQKFNDGFDKSSESLTNMGEYAESLKKDMSDLQSVMDTIAKDTNLTEKQKKDMLKDLTDEFMDSAEKLDEVIKDMGEKITDSLEEGLELIQDTAEGYEKVKDYAGEYAETLKDIYGPAAKDDIIKLYDVQLEAQNGIIDSLKEQQALAQQYVDALEPGSEEWNKANKELDDINEKLNSSTLELLDLMRSKMEDFFELTRESLEKDIFGDSLDAVEDKFDKINNQQEKYLNTAEKVAKLGKLQAQIQKEIANSSDPKQKAILQKFMDEELKALKEKDKLTEKDVERAEKLYVLTLKQQAVQNQQMTSMMARLVRDEAGNWSYEYVQDVNKVNEAQDELSASLEDIMNSDKENLKDNQKEMLDAKKKYFDDLEKLQSKAMSGGFESPEEFNKALEELNNQFMNQLKQLESEQSGLLSQMSQSSLAYIMDMYKQNGGSLGMFSEETEGTIGGILGALESGNLDWSDIITGNYDLIAKQLGITKEEAEAAIGEMTDSITEDFKETNGEMITDYEELRAKVEQATADMQENFTDYFNGVTESMGDQEEAIKNLNDTLDKQNKKIEEVTKSVNDEAKAIVNTLIPSYNALKSQYEKDINPQTQKFVDTLKDSITQIKNNNTSITGSKGMNEALQSLSANFVTSKSKATELIGNNTSGLKGVEVQAISAYNKITTLTGSATKSSISGTNSAVSGLGGNVSGVNSSIGKLPGVTSTAVDGVIGQLNRIPENKTVTVHVREKIVSVKKLSANREEYTTSSGKTKTGWGFNEGDYLTFKTGGYTGDWSKSEGIQKDKDKGKMAILHQKEMVLNAEDTKNLLESVKINRELFKQILATPIASVQTTNNNQQAGDTIIQIDEISLPNVGDAEQFVKELKTLTNKAIQYKYSKKPY